MIWTIMYTLPVVMAILFLAIAAVYHGAAVRKAMRVRSIENHSIRSVAIRVSIYSTLAFIAFATRALFPDVKDHGAAICLVAAGLPVSIAWGVGAYRAIKQAHLLVQPDQGKE